MNTSSTNRISAPIILDDLQNIQSAVFRGAVVDGCYQGRVRECLYVIWLNWPFNASLTTRRCLVGDPSGKSYGDVAFLEQHNLQSNILSDKFKMKFWHEHTLIQTQCVYCVTLCLLSRCMSGLSSTGWADGWTSSDFELMCGDGRRAPLSEWESCNLGVIPPNTIMTRPVLTARVYDFLMKSQVSICQVKLYSHSPKSNIAFNHKSLDCWFEWGPSICWYQNIIASSNCC